MDGRSLKRKINSGSTSEHKQEKRKRYSSSDLSDDSTTTSDADGGKIDKKCRSKVGSSKIDKKHLRKESKRKKKEKKHKHKKEKLKKKKKKDKSKSHKHKARTVKDDNESAAGKGLDIQPTEKSIVKRAMAPMTKEEYEKQQSIMKHVLDPDTGRYRLIRGDGEVMEEIVSHSRHKEINKQATKGDGATFQRTLGLGK